MARILILGGAGAQGWQAAETVLKRATDEDSIVLLSRDRTKGDQAAQRLTQFAHAGSVSSAVADLSISGSLAGHLRQGDILLNTAAPFFELGSIAAQIAIECGAHYYDICDDWEATMEILALHGRATEQRVAAVTGFGAAPGITSMLATIAMRELDEVAQIVTAWPVTGGGSSPLPSNIPFVHFVQCCVGPIRLMRDGHLSDEEPLKRECVVLPGGSELIGYTIGSPESVTLPIGNRSLRTSLNLALMDDATAEGLRAMAGAVRDGALSMTDAGNLLSQSSTVEDSSSDEEPSRLCAVATGQKNGVHVSVSARLSAWPDQDYTMAGTALGLVPMLMKRGKLGWPGAYSIEAVLSPEIYLDALARALSPDFQYEVETVSNAIKPEQDRAPSAG